MIYKEITQYCKIKLTEYFSLFSFYFQDGHSMLNYRIFKIFFVKPSLISLFMIQGLDSFTEIVTAEQKAWLTSDKMNHLY